MSFETKEEVLERVLAMEKPKCPHCQGVMSLWEVPDLNMGDGLGWGTPYLFICFNDECELYQEGWKNLRENYAHNASYRCMNYPGTETYECIPVFSPIGGTGQIIDEESIARQELWKAELKKGFSVLTDLYIAKDWVEIVRVLVDGTVPNRVRAKAAEMVGDLAETEAIDTLRNYKFGNAILAKGVDDAIQKIHDRHFTRECPFCAEIIKKRAKICKHCQRDVAGE